MSYFVYYVIYLIMCGCIGGLYMGRKIKDERAATMGIFIASIIFLGVCIITHELE